MPIFWQSSQLETTSSANLRVVGLQRCNGQIMNQDNLKIYGKWIYATFEQEGKLQTFDLR